MLLTNRKTQSVLTKYTEQIIIYTEELCEHTTNKNLEHSGRAFDLRNNEVDKNSEWVTVISSNTNMSCEISSTPFAAHSNAWLTHNGSCYCHQHTSNNCYHITYYCALTGNYTFTVLIRHRQISACVNTNSDPCWRLTEKADWRWLVYFSLCHSTS
jgi:hypothetical protein